MVHDVRAAVAGSQFDLFPLERWYTDRSDIRRDAVEAEDLRAYDMVFDFRVVVSDLDRSEMHPGIWRSGSCHWFGMQ